MIQSSQLSSRQNSQPSSKPASKQKSRYSSKSSEKSELKEVNQELVEEYKNIIQDRQRRQILLLCTDLTDKARSKHVVDSAVALRNTGHKYAFDLSQYRLPASKISFKGMWFPNVCLKRADKILVPNRVFYNIYKRSFSTDISPSICEPYLNVRSLKQEKLLPLKLVLEDMKSDTVIFLVLAEYHPRSNLELALDSFHLLVHSSEHCAHQRLRLVVAGHAGRGRAAYVRQLAARVRRLHLDTRVLLHPRPCRQHKKALLAGCLALLSCQQQGLWDRYVLEAMALGRPVIGVDNGFTKEVLEHGVTGYVVPPTPEDFSAAMAEIVFNESKEEFIGKMAHCEFIKKYSLEAFGGRLNKILAEFHELDKDNKLIYPEIMLENTELFFG